MALRTWPSNKKWKYKNAIKTNTAAGRTRPVRIGPTFFCGLVSVELVIAVIPFVEFGCLNGFPELRFFESHQDVHPVAADKGAPEQEHDWCQQQRRYAGAHDDGVVKPRVRHDRHVIKRRPNR